MNKLYMLAGVLLAAAILAGGATAEQADPAPALVRHVVSRGTWAADGSAGELQTASTTEPRTWKAQLTYRAEDSTVEGRIRVRGVSLFQLGNVRGRVSGQNVWGRITDDQGRKVARFRGRVSSAGAEGTFTTRTGETGSWFWEGPLR